MFEKLMNSRNSRRMCALAVSVVASVLTFFVVAQLGLYLSGAGIPALALAAWAAVFVFNYVPVHMLARIRPEVMHPAPIIYRMRPIDALGEVKELLGREYFTGRTWSSRSEDKEKKELVFVCRFQEPDVTDKGQAMIDLELQLLVSVVVLGDKVAVQLNYRLNDLRPSIGANEIAQETTAAIESCLKLVEENSI